MAETVSADRLRRANLFSRLSDAEAEDIRSITRPLALAKGATLFHEGDPATCFYLILSGWVALYRDTGAGERAVVGVFGADDTIAEAAMFLNQRFPVSAEAADKTELCVIERAGFEAQLKANPDLSLGMLAAISMHLHRLVGQVEQLKTQNAQQRLAGFLLSYCGGEPGPCRIRLPYDKALIASRLGMQPESFSRTLARLGTHGVAAEGGEIVVADPAGLAHLTRQPKYRRGR